jgi:protein-disulfide isomerase
MPVSRRSLLGFVAAPLFLPAFAQAATVDPKAERSLGRADAPVVVTEFFSLTCTHCATFSAETFPQVKSELIDTGKLRYVFYDFPLDQVALMAAMVARSLPAERYEPFAAALLASQDRWAFARGVNSTEELAKMAALAGMPRDAFNKVIADTDLRAWVAQHEDDAQKQFGIDATPTFLFTGKGAQNVRVEGEVAFDKFAQAVAKAAG